MEERIATIPADYDISKPRKKIKLTVPLKNAVRDRIKNSKLLYESLPFVQSKDRNKIKACMDILVEIISWHILLVNEKKITMLEFDRATDSSKKRKQRSLDDKEKRDRAPLEGDDRIKYLRKLTKTAHREIIAREMAGIPIPPNACPLCGCKFGHRVGYVRTVQICPNCQEKVKPTPEKGGKRIQSRLIKEDRFYYPALVRNLRDFFEYQTPTPKKYYMALIGLFGLHPRDFCNRCACFPEQRIPEAKRKIQRLTTKIRRGIDMCKLENMFDCHKERTKRINTSR